MFVEIGFTCVVGNRLKVTIVLDSARFVMVPATTYKNIL